MQTTQIAHHQIIDNHIPNWQRRNSTRERERDIHMNLRDIHKQTDKAITLISI